MPAPKKRRNNTVTYSIETTNGLSQKLILTIIVAECTKLH